MIEQTRAIRVKAFEDEMRLVIKELIFVYASPDMSIFKAQLDKYLNRFFTDYVHWHYELQEDHVYFKASHSYCLEFTGFAVPFPFVRKTENSPCDGDNKPLHIVKELGDHHYHLSVAGVRSPALCGESGIVETTMPVSEWRTRTGRNGTYCADCEVLAPVGFNKGR